MQGPPLLVFTFHTQCGSFMSTLHTMFAYFLWIFMSEFRAPHGTARQSFNFFFFFLFEVSSKNNTFMIFIETKSWFAGKREVTVVTASCANQIPSYCAGTMLHLSKEQTTFKIKAIVFSLFMQSRKMVIYSGLPVRRGQWEVLVIRMTKQSCTEQVQRR